MTGIEGKKYDNGKNRMGLVLQGFSNALWEVGRVGTFGCSKYGEGNWQYLENGIDRYKDALLRSRRCHSISAIPRSTRSCWMRSIRTTGRSFLTAAARRSRSTESSSLTPSIVQAS